VDVVVGILHFQERALSMPPEALVDELLQQAHEAEK
jgi:hypothetical protein